MQYRQFTVARAGGASLRHLWKDYE